jgi:hypothetical protein
MDHPHMCIGGRRYTLPRRREQDQARAAGRHSDLAFFFDISLRKYETSIIIFGYDTDLPGLRDRATIAITGTRRPVDNQSEKFRSF